VRMMGPQASRSAASGSTVSSTAASGYSGFQGFLKLQSTDGSAIEIEKAEIRL
jgi:hypothetical protein